eukprot:Nk52_evm39s621 gene=Nk52_evmTU39s621
MFTRKKVDEYLWQDREILFDAPTYLLQLRKGEELIAKIPNVQDAKSSRSYQEGNLHLTNLRLMLIMKKSNVNLSIGLHTISAVEVSDQDTREMAGGGLFESVCIFSTFETTRFSFTFTKRQMETAGHSHTSVNSKNNHILSRVIISVLNAYGTSTMYREVVYHSHLLFSSPPPQSTSSSLSIAGASNLPKSNSGAEQKRDLNAFVCLPGEKVVREINGAMRVTISRPGEGTLGNLIITTFRVVWYAHFTSTALSNNNVSFPYIQCRWIRTVDTSIGQLICIDSLFSQNKNQDRECQQLLLSIQPLDTQKPIAEEILSYRNLFMEKPHFWPPRSLDSADSLCEGDDADRRTSNGGNEENENVLSYEESGSDAFAAYYENASKDRDRRVVFSEEIGLAIEEPVGDSTIADLWHIEAEIRIPSSGNS